MREVPVSRTAGNPYWRRGAVAAAVVGALGVSSVALGLPWDIDMADGQQRKAYSSPMGGVPEGAIAQTTLGNPTGYSPNFVRGSPEAEALTMPSSSEETLALGEQMYGVYCTPCHGADGVNLGPVAQPGRLPGVIPLAGPAGIAKLRSDSWIYLTIRNGGAIMPAYGWAMNDEEMWAIVAHVRTLNSAAYNPTPTPAPAEQP
jgi:S-disulfanyl-L-cysteine oxidoreductase SoxD